MSTDDNILDLVRNVPRLPAGGKSRQNGANERIVKLGIPSREITPKVASVVETLLKKVDNLTQELARSKDNFIELEKMVDVDSVAPVPNRRAFMRRLSWSLAMNERHGHPCSILFFDINDFKQINDTYGHAAGDMAIRHVANIFLQSLRGSDYMARLSGDEFAVLMYYAEFIPAANRGSKIAAQIAQTPFAWGTHMISVSTAFGAYQVKKGDDPETALDQADKAMYANKKLFKKLGAAPRD